MTVLDLSSNDLSTLDPACFKAAGVTGVILGVYSPADPPNKMREAAQACRDAGLDIVAFYGVVYFGDDQGVPRDCDWAIQLAHEFSVPIVAMDVETDAADNGWFWAAYPEPDQRVAELLSVRKTIEAAGLQSWVYTYQSWWVNQMANSTAFSDLPLWYANYGANDGTLAPIREVNFGGWGPIVAHQFTSTLALCGRNRDANYLFMEDEVTRQELEDLWLAFASGSEEHYPAFEADGVTPHPHAGELLPRADRVAIAMYRGSQIVAGEKPSMLEVAYATKAELEAKPWLEDIAARVRTIPGLAGDQ